MVVGRREPRRPSSLRIPDGLDLRKLGGLVSAGAGADQGDPLGAEAGSPAIQFGARCRGANIGHYDVAHRNPENDAAFK